MTSPANNCTACQKSTLSLLLLRPSPVAKTHPLKAAGSDAVISDAAAMSGLLPAKLPTESRFALRLLRAGYVHVYIPSPPPGVKKWQTYRVSDQADLIAEKDALFSQADANIICTRKGHNPTGPKLLDIPQAHKINEIWIAFSANQWSDSLRKQNAANPKAMQQISLAGDAPNTFKPTAANLKSKVLECALTELRINRSTDHDFAFNSVAAQVENLADNLEKAAAGHPKTKSKEVAVVLRDPVGIATELNALRLRRSQVAQNAINAELAKPDNAHALNSSNTLIGLKTLIEDVEFGKALDKYAPPMTWGEYSQPRAATPFGGLHLAAARSMAHAKGEWEELPDERSQSRRLFAYTQGRLWYPDSTLNALKEGKKEAQDAWEDLEDEYHEAKRKQWHADFDARMKKAHLDELARFEVDWWNVRLDEKFNVYFALHFDENDPNKLTALHCPGLVYAAEVNRAATPAPFTTGPVLAEYLKELTADASKPSAVMLRGLVANQAAVIQKMQAAVSITETTHENRNDKLYDLGAALVLKTTGSASPKYAWLTAAMGNAMGGYALATVGSLGAAYSAAVTVGIATASGLPATRLAAISLVQRTTDLALQSIISGTRLNTPIIITKRFQAGRGMFLLTRGGRFSWAQARGLIRNGHIDIDLHTDVNDMRKVAGDMDQALLDKSAGSVHIPGQYPPALLVNHAAIAGTIALTEEKFAQLYARGGTKWGDLVNKVKTAYGEMEKTGAIMRSLEGRLALGVILLNGKGALDAIGKLNDPKLSELARIEARLALTDGVSSVLAATLQLREIVFKSQLEKQLGSQGAAKALEKTVTTHSLRAMGFFLGGVAGVANTWGAWMKAGRAREDGFTTASRMYYASFLAFSGMSSVFGLQTTGAAADYLVTKGVRNAVLRAAIQRVALRYGAASVLSLSGWGTALLGLAVLFEIGAIMLTPSEMEIWVSRTRFGKSSKKQFANWNDEEIALLALFGPAKPEDQAPPPSQPRGRGAATPGPGAQPQPLPPAGQRRARGATTSH